MELLGITVEIPVELLWVLGLEIILLLLVNDIFCILVTLNAVSLAGV